MRLPKLRKPRVMVCKADGIEAVPVEEAKRVIGRGDRQVTWKHVALFDPNGNPYCGKVLTDHDVEPQSET